MKILCSSIDDSDSIVEQFKSEHLIFCKNCNCESATELATELIFNTNLNFENSDQKQITINYDKLSFEKKADLVKKYNTENGGEFNLSWYKHKVGFGFFDGAKVIGFCNISLRISNYIGKAEVFLTAEDIFLLKDYRGLKIGLNGAKIISNEILVSVVNFINQYNKGVKNIEFFFSASCLTQEGEMFCDVMIESSLNQECLSLSFGGKANIEMEYNIGD